MTTAQVAALVLIVVGGAAVATQAPINAALSRSIGSGLGAAAVSFGVGFAVLVVATFVSAGAAPVLRLGGTPLWQLAGGLLGAYYVWAAIQGIAVLGAVTLLAALILGQLAAGLLLDHLGAFGLPVQPVSLRRIAAVALVMAGLFLSRG